MKKCLIECCKKEAQSRGLCHNDYWIAFKLVKSGKTTWDYLVKNKLANSSLRKSHFSEKFKQVLKK